MENSTAKETTRSYVFDYLRVIAMLGVLSVHFSQQFLIPGTILKQIMSMGAYCVQIFFVISAYLACGYFFKPSATASEYYKRRALRIFPTYYAAIIAAMIWIELTTKGYTPDIFHLGWLRYFLALNTILPSTDFSQWNNAFGFWTMTDFIYFYAVMPILIKFINTFSRCAIFFVICIIMVLLSRYAGNFLSSDTIFSNIPWLIALSPIGQMQHFAMGMMTFFAIREGKTSFAAVILASIAMLPHTICTPAVLFAILTCFLILTVKESDVKIYGKKRAILLFFSKYSFHIYLTHPLALSIANRISIHLSSTFLSFNKTKLLIFIGCTFILCLVLEIVQRQVNRLLSPKKP